MIKQHQRNHFFCHVKMFAVNHTTAAHIFNEAMQTLWPHGVKFDNILLLVIDTTLYMKKVTEELSLS
jgi:hypothetical protein